MNGDFQSNNYRHYPVESDWNFSVSKGTDLCLIVLEFRWRG